MRKLRFRPKAIIFDMDGVIIDSMPYHFIAWYEALRPFGVRLSCFDVYAKEGEYWEKTVKYFLRRENIEPSKVILKEIFSIRRKIFKRYFKRFIFKGTEDFLMSLKKRGYRLGLVTGSPAVEIRKILPKHLQGMFDCVIAGDQVKKGKPHPGPYLKAAKFLGSAPAECVVVENAPLGIESAKRAGMFCVALSTSLPAQYLKGADIVVNKLCQVSRIIG